MFDVTQLVEGEKGRLIVLATKGKGGHATVLMPKDENFWPTLHWENDDGSIKEHRPLTVFELELANAFLRTQPNMRFDFDPEKETWGIPQTQEIPSL